MAETRKKGFNLAEALGAVAVPDLGTAAGGREQIEYIDIDRIDDDPNNFYELSSLDELAANIELLGLQQPLRVRSSPENTDRVIIVSGHRRRAAIRKLVDDGRADLREIPCIRERAESSAALQELRLIYANSDTRKLTSAEISKQAERVEMLLYQLKEEGYEFPGRMRDHVAEACKVSKSKLSRLKVIRENLIPQLKKLWEKGKMNEAVAYACAQCPADMQKQLVEYSKQCQYYTTPDSWYENTIKLRIETLEREAKLTCKKGSPSGMCDNTEKRLARQATSPSWNDACENGKCCKGCPSLATCKSACPHLTKEIQAAKDARKAQQAKDTAARVEFDRPRVDSITALWKRFAEVRQASGLSMDAYLEAANIHNDGKIGKRYEGFERGEKIKADTWLPYCGGYGFPLHYIEYLRKTAEILGVSLDYLLCRTDEPAVGGHTAHAETLCADREPTPAGVLWYPSTVKPENGQEIITVDTDGFASEDCYSGGKLSYSSWDRVAFWTPFPHEATATEISAQGGWMPGEHPPETAGECVAVFDMGDDGAYFHTICYFDGEGFRIGREGAPIKETLVRWMKLPPEPEEENHEDT